MSVREIYRCDLCKNEDDENNYSLDGKIYGAVGEGSSFDCKMHINDCPSIDDDFNICHTCLKKYVN